MFPRKIMELFISKFLALKARSKVGTIQMTLSFPEKVNRKTHVPMMSDEIDIFKQ